MRETKHTDLDCEVHHTLAGCLAFDLLSLVQVLQQLLRCSLCDDGRLGAFDILADLLCRVWTIRLL